MSKAVQSMFHDIAPAYDRTNDVLSFGIHRLWRTKALKLAGLAADATVVDVCCGTGDVSFAAARRLSAQGRVIGVDFVLPMLELADAKPRAHRAAVSFVQGDALQLPLPDNCADVCTVSFGIRNVDDPRAGLQEMRRVCKPGGRIVVIEFGQPTWPGFATAYRLYSKYLMPRIGGFMSGNPEAYTYLPETAERFPAGERFLSLMDEAGLQDARAVPLLSGLAYIYLATA